MEEKQEFQLGDVFYLISKNYEGRWNLRKETVIGIKKEKKWSLFGI